MAAIFLPTLLGPPQPRPTLDTQIIGVLNALTRMRLDPLAVPGFPVFTSEDTTALAHLSSLVLSSQLTVAIELLSVAPTISLETMNHNQSRYSTEVKLFGAKLMFKYLDRQGLFPLPRDPFTRIKSCLVGFMKDGIDELAVNRPFERDPYHFTRNHLYAPVSRPLINTVALDLALLFLKSYIHHDTTVASSSYSPTALWPAFLDDLLLLLGYPPYESSSKIIDNAEQNNSTSYRQQLLTRFVLSLSTEIADKTTKDSCSFPLNRLERDARLRETFRQSGDAGKVVEAVRCMLKTAHQRLVGLRTSQEERGWWEDVERLREVRDAEELVIDALNAFGSLIGWIDVKTIITPTIKPTLQALLLYSSPHLPLFHAANPSTRPTTVPFTSWLLEPSSQWLANPIRLSATSIILSVISKTLRTPAEKMDVLRELDLVPLLTCLMKTLESEPKRTDETSLWGFARLVNGACVEYVKIASSDRENLDVSIRDEASNSLVKLRLLLLVFLRRPEKDARAAVFPALSLILDKLSPPLDPHTTKFLTAIDTIAASRLSVLSAFDSKPIFGSKAPSLDLDAKDDGNDSKDLAALKELKRFLVGVRERVGSLLKEGGGA